MYSTSSGNLLLIDRAFKLTKPTNGYGEKSKPFRDGGAWGDRGDSINALIEKMI